MYFATIFFHHKVLSILISLLIIKQNYTAGDEEIYWMKLKFKLALLMCSIIAIIVTGIAVLLLRQASNISIDLSLRGIKYLSGERAEFWRGREDGHLRMLQTMANVMSTYENLPPDMRRGIFSEMLLGTINSEQILMSVYTVWKPNALDGMDEFYKGQKGSGETGQFGMLYTRESGEIINRTTTDIENTMAYLSGPNSRKARVEHPVPRKVRGSDTYVIRMMVPIVNPHSGEIVGGVGCLVDIAAIQPMLEKTIRDHNEISAMIIYSGNGFIMGHYNQNRIGQMLPDADKEYGKNLSLAHQAVLAGKPYSDSIYDPVLDEELELVIEPIQIGNSDITWSIMVATAKKHVLTEVRSITRFSIIVAVIAISAAAVIVFLVLNFVTAPIIKVTNTLKDISAGEGDLTRRIPEKGKDEISDLSRYFNLTLEKIKNLIIVIKQQTVILFDIGNELARDMSDSAAAVNEITANIQSIKGRILNQSASVSQTGATMEKITVTIDSLNSHIEQQSGNVAQSSSAVEEMVANIRSVTDSLVKNSENVSQLSSASEIGRHGLETVVEEIQDIARDSQGLLEINAVMKNIASQTNLLSMNAAIEAAHAGEAGRGFAVVADEIRKLAEESGTQSKTISSVLMKIKESIDKITLSTKNVLTEFEAIGSGVKTVAEQEANLRNAMEEQDEGSKQILVAISRLNEISGQVKIESAEMHDGSKEVIQESRNLESVTHEITGSMNEMAIGAEQINKTVTRVNEISEKNKENINLLVKEISRFKVE